MREYTLAEMADRAVGQLKAHFASGGYTDTPTVRRVMSRVLKPLLHHGWLYTGHRIIDNETQCTPSEITHSFEVGLYNLITASDYIKFDDGGCLPLIISSSGMIMNDAVDFIKRRYQRLEHDENIPRNMKLVGTWDARWVDHKNCDHFEVRVTHAFRPLVEYFFIDEESYLEACLGI